jgi:hypothetical protein
MEAKDVLVRVGVLGAIGAGIFWWVQLGPVSAGDRARYEEECRDWISEEFAGGATAEVVASWKRRGQPVFQVATRSLGGTSRSLYLCVVDKRSNIMLKPSAFDTSWRRWP